LNSQDQTTEDVVELLDRRAEQEKPFVDVCFCQKHFSPATVKTNAVTIRCSFSWRPMKRDEGEGQIHCVTLPRVPSPRNSQYSYPPLVAGLQARAAQKGSRKRKLKASVRDMSRFMVRTYGVQIQTQGSHYSQTRILCNAKCTQRSQARSNLPIDPLCSIQT
jgi:hypothetical protein